jgi:hypothetical protein
MAATTGTNIVKDGLVLNIDAANIPKNTLSSVEYLIVAGGGSSGNRIAGGGGGGGLLAGVTEVTSQSYIITVGAGGSAPTDTNSGSDGNNGQNSTAFGFNAIGGGRGGVDGNTAGKSGGSGGGARGNAIALGGLSTIGQGNSGGNSASGRGGGGGGGAGQPGGDGKDPAYTAGNGGNGISSNITGTVTFYAGGGAGGAGDGLGRAFGGLGGGGDGGQISSEVGQNGVTNTGGGGGGGGFTDSSNALGGSGGSGVVIIRYPGPQRATGGTVTQVGNDIVHTFTAVGSSTFTVLPPYAQGQAFTTTSDFSGQGNFGTAVNGPTYSADNNGSFVFDGVNDHIDCGNTSSFNAIGGTNNITVSSWVFYTAFGGGGQPYSVITVKGNPWTWLMENPSNTFRFRITAGGSDVNVSDTVPHLLNTWYNVVGTYDGANMHIYVNGVLKNTRVQTGTIATNSITAKIGTFQGTNYNLTGRISNVSIFNRTLTANEIQQNFEALRGRYGI